MKKAIFIILYPLLAVIIYGCEEFIEKDLAEKNITILAPANNLVTPYTTTTFWWEELDGALDYNVQVVSPDFDMVEKLWADTIVEGNKFELPLVPGSFQWRIKGRNGSSETKFITASFVIDSTLNITSETVVLLSPADNAAKNNLSQIFKWSKLYNADEYRFKITNSDNIPLKDEVIRSGTESSFEFTADGSYIWSVRGQNDISNTLYSSYTIIIDTKSPGIPALKRPLNGEVVVTDTVRFEWTRVEDNGSPLFDSLCVFSDAELKESVISLKTDKLFYEEDSLEPGVYHWYVRTCDAAGNVGEKSSTFIFTKTK